MSSEQFIDYASGKTAKIAFKRAVDEALYDCGHAGYTGTIAEKDCFVMIPIPIELKAVYDGLAKGKTIPLGDVEDYIYHLFENEDKRIDDKWGPAGCMKIGPENFVFFGYASS